MAALFRISSLGGANVRKCLPSCLAIVQHQIFSTSPSSYYDILEVTPNASQKQVKAAYYKLSKKYHPDVNNSSDAEVKFRGIATAYETLSDKRRRRLYDQGLHHPSGAHRSSDFNYEEFLRNRGRFRKRREPATGRTPIFDFDEFYRKHYGEAREKQHMNKMKKEEVDVSDDRRKEYLVNTVFYVTMVASVFSYLIWKDRKKK